MRANECRARVRKGTIATVYQNHQNPSVWTPFGEKQVDRELYRPIGPHRAQGPGALWTKGPGGNLAQIAWGSLDQRARGPFGPTGPLAQGTNCCKMLYEINIFASGRPRVPFGHHVAIPPTTPQPQPPLFFRPCGQKWFSAITYHIWLRLEYRLVDSAWFSIWKFDIFNPRIHLGIPGSGFGFWLGWHFLGQKREPRKCDFVKEMDPHLV